MAHTRSLAGSRDDGDVGDEGDLPGRSGALADPLEDLQEWRPPSANPWAARVATLQARAPSGTVRVAGLAIIALAALGAGWWLLRPPAPAVETVLPLAESGGASGTAPASPGEGSPNGAAPAAPTEPEATTQTDELVVQAAGAVGRPGVYRLPADSRVDDLVREAAGLAPDADVDRVNLAAPLHDGERIWIPRVGEEETPEVVAGSGGVAPAPTPGSGGAGAEPGLVDLNTATAADLEALPGIGPATASAILAHRDQIGSFGSVDELIDVRGIGDAKMEQLRPLVTV